MNDSIHRTGLFQAAEQFIGLCYAELNRTGEEVQSRISDIRSQIERTGTYEHTLEELTHGAKWPGETATAVSGDCFGIV